MRNALILFIFCNGALIAQNPDSSPAFINLAQVEQAPIFPGCDNPDLTECSLEKISTYFTEGLGEELIGSLTPEERVVILRFIVDTEGNVRNPNVQSHSEELKVAGIHILQKLPQFLPGIHEGEEVNVIMDLPLKIKKKFIVSSDPDIYDSVAMPMNCKNNTNPKSCASEFVHHFLTSNINTRKIKTKGKKLKAVIRYTIDHDGKVTDVTAEGEDEGLNKEGVEVVKRLPQFSPATKDGHNVPMEFSLPITFYQR